jgi:hypothetical protein
MCAGSPTAGTWSSSQRRPDNEFETDRRSSGPARTHPGCCLRLSERTRGFCLEAYFLRDFFRGRRLTRRCDPNRSDGFATTSSVPATERMPLEAASEDLAVLACRARLATAAMNWSGSTARVARCGVEGSEPQATRMPARPKASVGGHTAVRCPGREAARRGNSPPAPWRTALDETLMPCPALKRPKP